MVSKHAQSCYFIQNGRHLYLIDGNSVQSVQFKEAWKYHMGQHNDLNWKFQSIWKKRAPIWIQIYQYAVVRPCLNTKHTNCNEHTLLCLEE